MDEIIIKESGLIKNIKSEKGGEKIGHKSESKIQPMSNSQRNLERVGQEQIHKKDKAFRAKIYTHAAKVTFRN